MPSGWPPLAAREPNPTSMAVAGVAGIVFRRSLLALLALELGALVLATALARLVLAPKRPTRPGGMILILAYAVLAVAFLLLRQPLISPEASAHGLTGQGSARNLEHDVVAVSEDSAR